MTKPKIRLHNIGVGTFLHIFDLLRDGEATVEGLIKELQFTPGSARVKLGQGKLIFKENMVEDVLNIVIRSSGTKITKQNKSDAKLFLKEFKTTYNKGDL